MFQICGTIYEKIQLMLRYEWTQIKQPFWTIGYYQIFVQSWQLKKLKWCNLVTIRGISK